MATNSRLFVLAGEHLGHLLRWAKAGIDDLNIASGLCDHLRSDISNTHWLPHIEHECLTMGSDGGSLKHEVDGFGNCHEVAGDVGVSDSDGAALHDLASKGVEH